MTKNSQLRDQSVFFVLNLSQLSPSFYLPQSYLDGLVVLVLSRKMLPPTIVRVDLALCMPLGPIRCSHWHSIVIFLASH